MAQGNSTSVDDPPVYHAVVQISISLRFRNISGDPVPPLWLEEFLSEDWLENAFMKDRDVQFEDPHSHYSMEVVDASTKVLEQ